MSEPQGPDAYQLLLQPEVEAYLAGLSDRDYQRVAPHLKLLQANGSFWELLTPGSLMASFESCDST